MFNLHRIAKYTFELVCYIKFCFITRRPRYLIYSLRKLVSKSRRIDKDIELLKDTIAASAAKGINDIFISKSGGQDIVLKHIKLKLAGVEYTLNFPIDWTKSFYDIEQFYSLHRFGWLVEAYASKIIGAADSQKLIDNWIFFSQKNENNSGWDSYSVSERVCNWLTYYIDSDFDIPDHVSQHIYIQLEFLCKNLEFRGTATNNHIINNGRALYLGGVYLNDKKFITIGKILLQYGLSNMFYRSGMHREGSSHYQVLMTRTYIEVLWFATIFKDYKFFEKIKHSVSNIYYAANALLSIEPFPYIGDMSPDFSLQFHKGVISVGAGVLNGLSTMSVDNQEASGWAKYYKVSNRSSYANEIINYEKFQDSGYIIYKNKNISFVMYVNPDPYVSNWSHAHSDVGSFVYNVNQVPIIISTGRKSYVSNKKEMWWREAESHNTIIIDKKEPLVVHGLNGYPELLAKQYFGKRPIINIIKRQDGIAIELTYFGYLRCGGDKVVIERLYEIESNSLSLTDKIHGKNKHNINTMFHFDGEIYSLGTGSIVINNKNVAMTINVDVDKWCRGRSEWEIVNSRKATMYGCEASAKCLVVRQSARLPLTNRYHIRVSKK